MRNLIEDPLYPAFVSVPENGVDPVAASTVTAGFQALANRTKYLNATKIAGPSSSTNRAVMTYDGTSGKLARNTGVVVDALDTLQLPNGINGGGSVVMSGGAQFGGSVSLSAGEFSYAPGRTKTKRIAPCGTMVNGLIQAAGGVRLTGDSPSPGMLLVPICLPTGAVITGISADVEMTSAVMYMSAERHPYGAAPAYIGDPNMLPAGPNRQSVAWTNVTPRTVNNAAEHYTILVQLVQAGTAIVYGFGVTYTDPGPRNY